jgi:hypothetical protein
MKQEAGVAWSRKRKTIQSINVTAVHELDNVTEVVLAAKPAIQLVCSTNVMCWNTLHGPDSQYTTSLEIAHDHAFIRM